MSSIILTTILSKLRLFGYLNLRIIGGNYVEDLWRGYV